MTDEFVNELLTKLEVLESEKANNDSLVATLQAESLKNKEKATQLEKEVEGLRQ